MCIYIYIYICMNRERERYTYTHTYIITCEWIYIYLYIYIYIHIHTYMGGPTSSSWPGRTSLRPCPAQRTGIHHMLITYNLNDHNNHVITININNISNITHNHHNTMGAQRVPGLSHDRMPSVIQPGRFRAGRPPVLSFARS